MKKYGHYNEEIDTLSSLLNNMEFSSYDERMQIEEDLKFWKENKDFLESYVPTPPSLKIFSDTTLKCGGKTFKILFFGTAHTDNDLVVLDCEDRLLIMGDLLCLRKCYIMSSRSGAENWIALLDHLIERQDEYDYVIPGHGGTVETVDALKEQRDYLTTLVDSVRQGCHRGFSLQQLKEELRLEKYRDYLMYDRIGLDIDAVWQQLKGKE